MVKSGLKRPKFNHKDRDYLKNFHPRVYAGIETPTIPPQFLTYTGTAIPDQNALGEQYGCTNFAQAFLADLLDPTKKHDPMVLEALSHANANGGIDIRVSLGYCLPPDLLHPNRLGWITGYYNIRPVGIVDAFSAFQLAIMGGLPEQRALTVGMPWFPSWQAAAHGAKINTDGTFTYGAGDMPQGLMPMPTDAELAAFKRDPDAFPWHDSAMDGWITYTNKLCMRDESWQGTVGVGDNGFLYFPREVINTVIALSSSCMAFTVTNTHVNNPLRIDATAIQWIVSLIRQIFHVQ